MRALDDQIRLGKVLYLGVSDTPAWVVTQLQTLAATRGWSIFAGLQVEYSLVQREVERELAADGLGLAHRYRAAAVTALRGFSRL